MPPHLRDQRPPRPPGRADRCTAGAGLLDDESRWSGGAARLWVLGDLVDRGPDGLGVIALVRRLVEEAARAGGAVLPVLGNHEVIALGMRRFGDAQVVHRGVVRTFYSIWARNGGLDTDQAGIDDELFDWLAGLPAIGRDGDHLLMHSDTTEYLEWGGSVDAINDAVRATLANDDPVAWFDVLVRLAQRHEYAGSAGPLAARRAPRPSAGSGSSTATASSATSSASAATPTASRASTATAWRSTSTGDLRGRAVPGRPPLGLSRTDGPPTIRTELRRSAKKRLQIILCSRSVPPWAPRSPPTSPGCAPSATRSGCGC